MGFGQSGGISARLGELAGETAGLHVGLSSHNAAVYSFRFLFVLPRRGEAGKIKEEDEERVGRSRTELLPLENPSAWVG